MRYPSFGKYAIASLAVAICFFAGDAASCKETYRCADLPALMKFADGAAVKNLSDWSRRKDEIRRLMCETFVGAFPKNVPALLNVETLAEIPDRDGVFRRRVRLTFDTPSRASFETWIWVPSGKGRFPALLVAPKSCQMGWANEAVSRGYIVCLYPGIDSHHRELGYPGYDSVWKTFRAEYPKATWTEIGLKGWLASRALDYLLDPKYGYPIIKEQVAIIGHSRYAKQALIAAAFDERISAVVARSSGSPGASPYRFASRTTFAEAPSDWPGDWFVDSLKKYTGREDELPIDSHGWLALIAPRPCMLDTALHDGCDPTFAVERAYLKGKKVYRFLGCPQNLCLSYRAGAHRPITDEHRRGNLEWLDLSFGRGTAKQGDFPEELIHRFDWDAWKSKLSDGDLNSPAGDASGDRRDVILWSLGKPPEKNEWDGKYTFLSGADESMMTHDRWRKPDTARLQVSFGANVHGNIYYNPKLKDEPRPVVIWLHPYSYQGGYNESYGVQGTTVYHRLAQEGCVVLAYDQCGFGLRLLEGRDFYKRHPKWSRLGRMVRDVSDAVDFLTEGRGAANGEMPKISKNEIYVLGYSLGGTVGLYVAALDKRIAGAASFDGFTPLRTDTDAKHTGGIRRLWSWHALQPLLGLYDGRESEIPCDYHDVLALIAPRPCLIYSARRDRHADFNNVMACVAGSRAAWEEANLGAALTHITPDTTSAFQKNEHSVFIKWLQDAGKMK